jgi:hypothetical protein
MMKKQLLITSLSLILIVGGLVGITHAAFTAKETNSEQVQTVNEATKDDVQVIVADKQQGNVEDDHLSIVAVVPQVNIEAVQQVKVEEVPQVKAEDVQQVKVEDDQQGDVDDDQQGDVDDDQQDDVDDDQQDNVDDDQQDDEDNDQD